MDAAQEIARKSSYCAAVLCKLVGSEPEFRFVELDGTLLASIKCRLAILQEGFRLVMFVGIMDGKIVSAEYKETQTPQGDAVTWLEKLHSLEDPRTN